MTTPAESTARRARVAVSALFLVNGALIANVLPRLPAIKASLDLSNAEFGAAVAAMPVGGLIAGGFAGWLIHRVGSGSLAVATGVVLSLLLAWVGLAPSWIALAGGFLVLGVVDATMDAAENAHGVLVQRRYGRSILHAFHGWWSAGTLVGGATGALAANAAVPVPVHLAVVGGALAGVSLVASRGLLGGRDLDVDAGGVAPPEPVRPGNALRLLRLLGPLALLGVLGVMLEDAAQTWSTVYVSEVLGVGAGLAAVAYVLYAAAMTAGRLTNDLWVNRWGAVMVARAGAIGAAAGIGFVIVAGVAALPPLAYGGYVAIGLGAASMFPIMVDRAARIPGVPPAHGIAIVSWLARVGFVIAPALVGVAADVVGLAIAFLVPLAAALGVAVFAGTLLAEPAPRQRVATRG
jgi:fucose permease